jgi:hypothetical protein
MATMIGQGVEVDWETGDPVDQNRPSRQQQRAHHQEMQAFDRAIALRAALGEQEGQAVIMVIRSRLAARIDTLVASDPEAKAYVDILETLGGTLAVGQRAADALTEANIRTR